MKCWSVALCALLACLSPQARAGVWQPGAGHSQLPLWPGTPPDDLPMPGAEYLATETKSLVAGKPYIYVSNVREPTLTVYAPTGRNTGAAVLVIPGGGFQILAMDLEGTEVCDWLNRRGVTCVLLKYRVPSEPYDWHCDCRPRNREVPTRSLEDVQRAMGLIRLNAEAWHVDPHRVGVIGFSAGGYLVAEISTHFDRRLYAPVDAADRESCRPDFAIGIYPGHLATDQGTLNPNVPVSKDTPPTFLLQAEDDHVDGIQSPVYYAALQQAGVPAELHVYAHGGHAFGLRRTHEPITAWPDLVDTWLKSLGVVPD
ncbi:MAG TPA: alpha/beta hydrolase [Gammaproteobacteria bacterium]|nr:alpha/beta hydrolase [Gammaproteobacteria bacterium]